MQCEICQRTVAINWGSADVVFCQHRAEDAAADEREHSLHFLRPETEEKPAQFDILPPVKKTALMPPWQVLRMWENGVLRNNAQVRSGVSAPMQVISELVD